MKTWRNNPPTGKAGIPAHDFQRWFRRRMDWRVLRPAPGIIARFVIASVWFYHGLMNKILAPSVVHASVVDSVPFFGTQAGFILTVIGLLETLVGFWVLSGYRSRFCAVFQTFFLVIMNAGGLFYALHVIADPVAMLLNNIVFMALIWL